MTSSRSQRQDELQKNPNFYVPVKYFDIIDAASVVMTSSNAFDRTLASKL